MSPNIRIFSLCVAIIALGIYKVTFPWTPFWVDLCVIAVALVVALGSSKSKKPEGDRADKGPN